MKKPSSPSLVLYFTACFFAVIFKLLECDSFEVYTKSVIVPLIFIYYFITNNYKININIALIFLFCFTRDVFNLLDFKISPLGVYYSFLMVNLLLLRLSYKDFEVHKFVKKDRFPIIVFFLFIATVIFTVSRLHFENLVLSFYHYLFYAVVLGILFLISIINYIKKPNFAFLNLVIFCLCSMVSGIFFMINKYYLSLFVISVIQVSVQIFSYFFMVTYFIEKEKQQKGELNHN